MGPVMLMRTACSGTLGLYYLGAHCYLKVKAQKLEHAEFLIDYSKKK
jgi:hypothetical protein